MDAVVRVRVDDEGPGLPPGDPARLFDKFQRGGDEGTVVGVGLGLAICRAILRAHGGDIEARARPGGGARFEFTLPTTEAVAMTQAMHQVLDRSKTSRRSATSCACCSRRRAIGSSKRRTAGAARSKRGLTSPT